MTSLASLVETTRDFSNNALRNRVALPSPGVSAEAQKMERTLREMWSYTPHAYVGQKTGAVETATFEARLRFKLLIANVAMHIRDSWRESLFKQLDEILDADEWDERDAFPSIESTRTFLRMIIHFRFQKCPGLGLTRGNVVAAWTSDDRRLTIECLPDDLMHWVYSRRLDSQTEVATGKTRVTRLPDVLTPYLDGFDWVLYEKNQPAR